MCGWVREDCVLSSRNALQLKEEIEEWKIRRKQLRKSKR